MDELARIAEELAAEADPRRLVGLSAPARLRRASARSPTRSAPPDGRHGALRRPRGRRASTRARCPYADVVTTTVHKTLGGARGGMILCREEYAKKIDSAVFPGQQGGPLDARDRRQGGGASGSPQTELFRERQRRTRAGAKARGRGDARPAGRQRAHRRHRRAPRARRPARVRARRPAGRGPPARDRHHRQPQRGALRPAPADGHLRPARRRAGARHPRPAGRRLPRGRAHHRRGADARTSRPSGPSWPSASRPSPSATRCTSTSATQAAAV